MCAKGQEFGPCTVTELPLDLLRGAAVPGPSTVPARGGTADTQDVPFEELVRPGTRRPASSAPRPVSQPECGA